MIKNLTPEQEAKFSYYIKKWTDIGLSTEPANRRLAEEGINKCYVIAGLEPPKKIIWCGSPLSMFLTKHVLSNLKDIKIETGTAWGTACGPACGPA